MPERGLRGIADRLLICNCEPSMYSFPKIAGLAAAHCYHGDLALTRYFLPVLCACLRARAYVHACVCSYVILRQPSGSYIDAFARFRGGLCGCARRSHSHVVSAPRYIIDGPFNRAVET